MTRQYTGPKCKTHQEVIVVYLWESGDWHPTYEMQNIRKPYGITGSSGDRRAFELARNDCPAKLRDKVKAEKGAKLGLDRRYTYFHYKF